MQVWSRLEENGHINMRVLPSQIEFTLPSPKIGIETLPLVDPAWLPRSKTKLDNIDMRRRGTTIISATKVGGVPGVCHRFLIHALNQV
jgi:hypothetical protein